MAIFQNWPCTCCIISILFDILHKISPKRASSSEEINTGVQGFHMGTLPATTHAGGRGLKSTTHLYQVPGIRITVGIYIPPPCHFTICTRTGLPLP